MHWNVAIDNTFPVLPDALEGPCKEALLETMAYYRNNNLEVKASKCNTVDRLMH